MSCQTKAGTAQFVDYMESRYGVHVTQQDWHALRTLAEVEKGSPLKRARLTQGETEKLVRGLSFGDDSDGPKKLTESLGKEFPTEGTARALNYLNTHGVKETLQRIREGRSAEGKVGSYSVKLVTAEEGGGSREYVFHVNSAESAGNLVKSSERVVSCEIAETVEDGSMRQMSPGEAETFVERGWASHKEMNAVVPVQTSYAVQVTPRDPNQSHMSFNYHVTKPEDVQKIIDESGGPLMVETKVAEERTGYTLANPNDTKTVFVDLSDDDLEDLLSADN